MIETSSVQVNRQMIKFMIRIPLLPKSKKKIKWRNWRICLFLQSGKKICIYIYIYIYVCVCLCVCVCVCVYIYIRIFLFIITKWIKSDQCHLFPGKTWMIYITSRNCSGEWKKWSNFLYLYIWFYFHKMQNIARTPFIRPKY